MAIQNSREDGTSNIPLTEVDYGITSAGFVMPTFSEWVAQYQTLARTNFGMDINLGSESVIGQLLEIFAYQDIQVWEALQSVYDSQTVNGAEGIYLDEIFAKRGVFRRAEQAGYGYAYIETDSRGTWNTMIGTNTQFSARNGQTYNVTTPTQIKDRVVAFKVKKSDLETIPTGKVTYSITNTTTGLTESKLFDFSATSHTLLNDIATFIKSNLDTSSANTVMVVDDVLYMGFSRLNLDTPIGMFQSVEFFSDSRLGNRWSLFPVKCNVTGQHIVYVDDITGITPAPQGYVSIGNFQEFFAGSFIETDAEFRVRFNSNLDEAGAATRSAVFKAVSDLPSVVAVRIFDNPNEYDLPEAERFSFNVVVLGGETEAIAKAIYNKKPINTRTSGSTSYAIPTEDGGIETIKFSFGAEDDYTIKIQYRTQNGTPLTAREVQNIQNGLRQMFSQLGFGATLFNSQLQAVVFNSLLFGRLIQLVVKIKPTNKPDTVYTSRDYQVPFDVVARLQTNNILFEQSLLPIEEECNL